MTSAVMTSAVLCKRKQSNKNGMAAKLTVTTVCPKIRVDHFGTGIAARGFRTETVISGEGDWFKVRTQILQY